MATAGEGVRTAAVADATRAGPCGPLPAPALLLPVPMVRAAEGELERARARAAAGDDEDEDAADAAARPPGWALAETAPPAEL